MFWVMVILNFVLIVNIILYINTFKLFCVSVICIVPLDSDMIYHIFLLFCCSNMKVKCKYYKTLSLSLYHYCMRWCVNFHLNKACDGLISQWCFDLYVTVTEKKKDLMPKTNFWRKTLLTFRNIESVLYGMWNVIRSNVKSKFFVPPFFSPIFCIFNFKYFL